MVDTAGASSGVHAGYAEALGIEPGQTVQEVGWDDDCDEAVSEAVEDVVGSELLDEDTDEIVDSVLLWWRADDGDLVDGLVDAIRPLAENGRIWLLTPGPGRPGTVERGVIEESATLAGLVGTSTARLGQWTGSCLVQRPNRR